MKTAAVSQPRVLTVEDVQSRADTRQIPINQVGIKDINHPVRVKDRSEGEQHTVANFNMYVNLPHNFKGTHMSRFVEILHREREISVESFGALLTEMTERLEADAGHIEMSFPYFVMKKAPVSGVESYMDYRASLVGQRKNGETSMWVKARWAHQVTSRMRMILSSASSPAGGIALPLWWLTGIPSSAQVAHSGS